MALLHELPFDGAIGTASLAGARTVRRRCSPKKRWILLVLVFGLSSFGNRALAQTPEATAADYTKNPEAFPNVFNPYHMQKIPKPEFNNSAAVRQMIHDGKLSISVSQLLAAMMENNLDIAAARFNRSFSQTDVLRAKAGGAPRGSAGVTIPAGLFAGALGAGLGNTVAGVGGAQGPAISSNGRLVSLNPRGGFDPAISVNFSMDRSDSPLNTIRVSGVSNVINSTATLQSRYAQAFTTGTSFSLGFNTLRQSSNQKNLRFSPAYTPTLTLIVTQQLLNGFGFTQNRRFLEVANNGRQIAREVFRQQVITTLAQAQNSYWDLVGFRETVRAAEQALEVAEQLREDNKKQAEIGTLAPLDVTSAESEVATRRRDLIVAQTNLQQAEVQLKTLLSKSMDPALASAQIEATDRLPDPSDADIPKLDEAFSTALRNRPELRQQEGTVQNEEVAVHFSKEALKPTFEIFGQLASASLSGTQIIPGVGGAPPTIVRGGWSDALGQVGGYNFPSYAFGFSLVIPIRNRSAQADNARANLEERQSEIDLQRTRNQIALEVRNAVIGLMQAKSQVEAAAKAVQFERQTLDAEQKKLAAGTSTPYSVILVQRDLLAAELSEVQARAAYAKARVEMDRATGVMLEKNHIDPAEVPRGEFAQSSLGK